MRPKKFYAESGKNWEQVKKIEKEKFYLSLNFFYLNLVNLMSSQSKNDLERYDWLGFF